MWQIVSEEVKTSSLMGSMPHYSICMQKWQDSTSPLMREAAALLQTVRGHGVVRHRVGAREALEGAVSSAPSLHEHWRSRIPGMSVFAAL